jgi:hypothetical protein
VRTDHRNLLGTTLFATAVAASGASPARCIRRRGDVERRALCGCSSPIGMMVTTAATLASEHRLSVNRTAASP